MKIDIRKKRFLISLAILICGVFALYPYLVYNPQRELLKSVSKLDSQTAASVIKTVLLGEALLDKGSDLSLTGETAEAVEHMLEELSASVSSLKTELRNMPPKSKALTARAEEAYKKLDEMLTNFIITLSQSQK